MVRSVSILKNYKLLIIFIIVLAYFYLMLINFYTGNLSSGAVICVFMICFAGIVCLCKSDVASNKLGRLLVPWFFWSLILCVLCKNTLGQTTSSILWICAFLFSYGLVNKPEDVSLVSLFATLICIMSLFFGATTLNLGEMIGIANFGDSDLDMNENIGVFVLITLPIVMLLKNHIIKWSLFIVALMVILLTARRTATICFALIFILHVIQEKNLFFNKEGTGRNKVISIILISVVVYGVYMLLTNDFSIALERVLDRFLEMKEDNGSGRTELYQDVWNSFLKGDFFEIIIGHGYYGVNRVTRHTAAHNDFLEYLFDYGIVGLIFYCRLHIFLIKRMLNLYKTHDNMAFSYAASYCVFFFYGMFGNIIIYPQYFLTIPIYWGVAEKMITWRQAI